MRFEISPKMGTADSTLLAEQPREDSKAARRPAAPEQNQGWFKILKA